MRRVFGIVLALVLMFALSGCGELAPGYGGATPSASSVVRSAASHAANTSQAQAVLRPTEDPIGQAALAAINPADTVGAPLEQQLPAEPEPFVPTAKVSKTANVRTYPSTTSGAIITTVSAGEEVLLLSKIPGGTWYMVLTPNARKGYISASLLQMSDEVFASIEIEAAAPAPPRQPAPRPVKPVRPVAPAANCEPSYPDICIPIGSPDLDCPDMSVRRFRVIGSDPHRFDGDGDGIGCE